MSYCFSCRDQFPDSELVWDEGDDQWCGACIDRWERENQQDWATGQPLRPATTCLDCGQKGHHQPNCPRES